MNDLITKRLKIANHLYNGNCGGSYDDAVIILVSIISAMASKIWPGTHKDRKRFVELLITETDSNLETKKISVPLLLQDLEKVDKTNFDILKKHSTRFYGSSRVFEGTESDKLEDEILNICPGISKKNIRRFSYASVLYSEVRSGLIHEYKITKNASSQPMHDYCKSVSYLNIAQINPFCLYHSIHFHYEWIDSIVLTLQKSLDSKWQKTPYNDPNKWWIEG